jgi:3-ketosteroid 9alpha-monooxygenase subunit A
VHRPTLGIYWHGLGLSVTRTRGILDLLFIGTHTPVEENLLDSSFSFSLCRARGLDPEEGAGLAFINESVRQMELDIPIWENKRFQSRPVLCDGDGPIEPFRAWASQFYSEASE